MEYYANLNAGGKEEFLFFFFAQKESSTVYTLLLFFFPFRLASFRDCSLLTRLPRGGKGKETHFGSETWRKMKRVEEEEVGRRRNPSLFARRSRMGRKSTGRGGIRGNETK